jgi:hypothetical protein
MVGLRGFAVVSFDGLLDLPGLIEPSLIGLGTGDALVSMRVGNIGFNGYHWLGTYLNIVHLGGLFGIPTLHPYYIHLSGFSLGTLFFTL